MTENQESATQTRTITEIGSDTKKINSSSRAEIDTSPPFGSVEEAVTHFGGRGSWIPQHLLRLPPHHGMENFDIERVEERAAELEKDLLVKEQETLDVLKDLEAAKRVVEVLKFMVTPNSNSETQTSTPKDKSIDNLSLSSSPSPGFILMELNQAKMNFNKTTDDLAFIRASVDSLNKKMRKERTFLERNGERQKLNNEETKDCPQSSTIFSRELQNLSFEAEQFRAIADGARYEIMKANSEIEQTKTSINMVEMRLIAAKKMEEAARAVEAIAVAEVKARSNYENPSGIFMQKPQGITISYEEYSILTQKAQKAEEILRKKAFDTKPYGDESDVSKMATFENFGEIPKEVKYRRKSLGEALGNIEVTNRAENDQMRHSGHNSTKFKFKNSYPSYGHRDPEHFDGNEESLIKDKSMPMFRSTISIGDILSRKLILQDDFVVGKKEEAQDVSLSQMLREQSGLIFSSSKAVKDESVRRQFFGQKKKFGFIHVSLPLTRQSKKKVQNIDLMQSC